MIIEMRLLWLVEDYFISRHNDLMRGGYSRALNLKITALRLKRKIWTFRWLNQVILQQIITYLDKSNHHDWNKMCEIAMLSLFTEFTKEFESTWAVTKTAVYLRLSEYFC